MVTLDDAGEAEIDFVRVRQTIDPVTYDGHFLSSDDLLNRAWYARTPLTDRSVHRDTPTRPCHGCA